MIQCLLKSDKTLILMSEVCGGDVKVVESVVVEAIGIEYINGVYALSWMHSIHKVSSTFIVMEYSYIFTISFLLVCVLWNKEVKECASIYGKKCVSIKKEILISNACLRIFTRRSTRIVPYFFFAFSSVGGIPELLYGLQVRSDFSFNMFFHGNPVFRSEIRHICGSETIQRFSDVTNILAFLKNKSGISHQSNILMAKELLESITEEEGLDYNDHISFTIEQLQLHLSPLKGQRTSSRLLAIASLWQNTSPPLYNQLCASGVIILPSIKYLKKLSSAFNIDGRITDEIVFIIIVLLRG
ncbi:unnamed protein product [Lepeophtheirus salmonis]|uniref:(salmon louse) hypothetical protein n=1 Tax=Lepeophtheirus salmonis TaxID=72036 RepID=A0A7R8CFL0_LEPSM|nr:unnamed protein product [Lepeophtheirus salmonis]CAF2801727.1 unnamed protein product [Lepeophtheirus salmonis]